MTVNTSNPSIYENIDDILVEHIKTFKRGRKSLLDVLSKQKTMQTGDLTLGMTLSKRALDTLFSRRLHLLSGRGLIKKAGGYWVYVGGTSNGETI